MRITELHIAGFGQFEDYTIDDLDHPLVVFLGPNEAGKSTIFQFLVTMLYGFSPADRDRHPYRPLDGATLAGRMEFRSGNSRCSVKRRLKSTPAGELSIGSDGLFGSRESIRNRVLRMTGDVSRDVFESIYALTLQDMAGVSGRAWNSIQDRLLGGLNLDTLRVAREVVEELEAEAKHLWRPDRRGKTRAQEIRGRLRALRADVHDARERDNTVRRLHDEIAAVRRSMAEAEQRAREVRRLRDRAARLLPVKARLDRIELLSNSAGDLSEFDCIPSSPKEKLNQYAEEIERVDAELEEVRESVRSREAAAESFAEDDRRLEAAAAEIRAWHARAALFTQRRLRIDESERKLHRLRIRRDEIADRLITGGWSTQVEQLVRSISVNELREAVRRFHRARDEMELTRARLEGVGVRVAGRPGVGWAAVILGLILALAGLLLAEPAVWGPALATTAVAVGFLAQSLSLRKAALTTSAPANGSEVTRKAADHVRRLLGEMPVSAFRRENPDSDLPVDLHALQTVLAEIDTEEEAAKAVRSVLEKEEHEAAHLLGQLGVKAAGSPEAELDRLFRDLAVAEKRKAASDEASRHLPADRKRLGELEARLEELHRSTSGLRARLAEVGAGDYLRGIQVVTERRAAAQRAESIREELEAGYPDLESIRAELQDDSDSLPLSSEEIAQLEDALENIARTLRDGHASIASNETRIRSLLEQPAVSELESEVSLAEQELQDVCSDRDRLMLLANIVRSADARFRDRHQPDVIRRASDILLRLTNGRYGKLEVSEEDGSLSVRDERNVRRLPVGTPLSRGTLDQIYLALRLGLADHLDSSGDRLPLFLDEILVNWDSSRRRAACDVISDLSASRQVLFFTCHEWLAGEIRDVAGARIVKL